MKQVLFSLYRLFSSKPLFILLGLFNTIFEVRGQTDHFNYPKYEFVIKKFASKYSMEPGPNVELKFEKRPDGWHVVKIDYSSPQPDTIKNILFWGRKKRAFKALNFKKVKKYSENEYYLPEFEQDDYTKEQYNIHPYYGYPGWDWDVIQEFKDVANSSETILYALGRAYSSYARNLLNNNSGLADPKHQFKLGSPPNAMTIEQLEKYRYYQHLSIKTFNKLNTLNPDFETTVGKIGTKLSNEYMASFLNLRIYQNEQEARKEIKEGLYSDFYIAAAKNMLNTCAKNAILFTYGDNDTDPLLYVQAQYRFRTDVLVVNISLLQTDIYINSLRKQVLDASPIPISFTPKEISDSKRTLIMIKNERDHPMELTEVINYIKDDQNMASDYSFSLPSNKFRLTDSDQIMEWQIDRHYFERNHLILLDMLATNKLHRPLYFASTSSQDSYFGLDDYLQLEGLAYRLTFSKKQKKTLDWNTGRINTEVLYDNLMNKFDWKGIIKSTSVSDHVYYVHYRQCFNRLATALIEENKLDSAKQVLDQLVKLIPDNILYYSYFDTMPLIENYYILKEFPQGNAIAKTLLYNLKNNIGNDKSWILNKEQKDYALNEFKLLAQKYKQVEILKLFNR